MKYLFFIISFALGFTTYAADQLDDRSGILRTVLKDDVQQQNVASYRYDATLGKIQVYIMTDPCKNRVHGLMNCFEIPTAVATFEATEIGGEVLQCNVVEREFLDLQNSTNGSSVFIKFKDYSKTTCLNTAIPMDVLKINVENIAIGEGEKYVAY